MSALLGGEEARIRGVANDRQGLVRLCRYGARGALSLERLSLRDDGLYEYRTKKGHSLVVSAAELVKRLLAIIPPPRAHLTSFHGLFAPNAMARSTVMLRSPKAPVECRPTSLGRKPHSPDGKAPNNRRPRLDFATLVQRTFGVDLWTCPCGGKRKVLAVVSSRRAAEEMLRNMGILDVRPPTPKAQAPPQLSLAL